MGSRLLKYLQENEGQGSLGRPLALPTVCHGIISSFKEYFSPRASKTDKSRNQRINCYSQRKSTFPVFLGGGGKKVQKPAPEKQTFTGKKGFNKCRVYAPSVKHRNTFFYRFKKKKNQPIVTIRTCIFFPFIGDIFEWAVLQILNRLNISLTMVQQKKKQAVERILPGYGFIEMFVTVHKNKHYTALRLTIRPKKFRMNQRNRKIKICHR